MTPRPPVVHLSATVQDQARWRAHMLRQAAMTASVGALSRAVRHALSAAYQAIAAPSPSPRVR